MPESRLELQHSGSPSEKATLEEKAWTNFFGRRVGESGVGCEEIADAYNATAGLAVVLPGGRRIEVRPDFDTSTFERLVTVLERV